MSWSIFRNSAKIWKRQLKNNFLPSLIMYNLWRKWFLFIWWGLTAIWIGGIFSAALFPSLTWYLKRSRDAARTSHLKDISNALGAYYSDKERYPDAEWWCVPVEALGERYMEAGIPKDPTENRLSGYCDGKNGTTYGYGSFTGEYWYPGFYLVAEFESQNGGNSAILPDPYPDEEFGNQVRKWNGKYYILYK